MKAYKVEVLALPLNDEDASVEHIIDEVTRSKYLFLYAMHVHMTDIGEWHDGHPLNNRDTKRAEYERLFPPGQPSEEAVQTARMTTVLGDRLNKAERERDEARKQVAALTAKLNNVRALLRDFEAIKKDLLP